MGAQNASAQPGLRLSTHRLLLPGHRYPDAQLRAEPLVRIQLFRSVETQRGAPAGHGDEGCVLCRAESSPGVLVLPGSLQPADLFRGLEHPSQAEGCNKVAVVRRANRQHQHFLPHSWGSFPCPACSRVAGRLLAQHGSYPKAESFHFLLKTINEMKPVFKKPPFPVQESRIICALSEQPLQTLICDLFKRYPC